MVEFAGMLPGLSKGPLSLPGDSAESDTLHDDREDPPQSSAGAQKEKLIGQEPQVRNSQCSVPRFWGLAIWMICWKSFKDSREFIIVGAVKSLAACSIALFKSKLSFKTSRTCT